MAITSACGKNGTPSTGIPPRSPNGRSSTIEWVWSFRMPRSTPGKLTGMLPTFGVVPL